MIRSVLHGTPTPHAGSPGAIAGSAIDGIESSITECPSSAVLGRIEGPLDVVELRRKSDAA
jgi:hypothetical protein